MLIKLTSRYHVTKTGRGKIQAKGCRRQVTASYPYHVHPATAHFSVADQLADKLERENNWRLRLLSAEICGDFGSFHTVYTFEVFDDTVPYFDNWEAVKYQDFPAGYAH